jgi:hypothetical protein
MPIIDIREHGGPFGAGKYRKGSRIPIANTDLKSMPLEFLSSLANGYVIYDICVHYDKSFTVIYSQGSNWYIRGFDKNGQMLFDFCPTQVRIWSIMKHSNGKYYMVFNYSIYEYSGTGTSVTQKYNNNALNGTVFMYELNGKIVCFTGSQFLIVNPNTWVLEQTITPTNPPTSSLTVDDIKVFNGFIYAKYGGYYGPIIELPYDVISNPTPSFRKTGDFYGSCIGVSNSYVASFNTATGKIDLYNRSTFAFIKSLSVTFTGTSGMDGLFIEEENDAIIWINRGGNNNNDMVQRLRISNGTNIIPITDLGGPNGGYVKYKEYDKQTYLISYGAWTGSYVIPYIGKLKSYVTIIN